MEFILGIADYSDKLVKLENADTITKGQKQDNYSVNLQKNLVLVIEIFISKNLERISNKYFTNINFKINKDIRMKVSKLFEK